MKPYRILSAVVALLALHAAFTSTRHNPSVAQEASPRPRVSEAYARRVKDFAPARELLKRKGVPFEPDLLLSRKWAQILAPKFAQMPEMRETRRLGKRFKGVQLGDILYLPEKVEITGDTVLLARQIIFEGRHAVIKGNYSVYFFPVEANGVLGTTLESALKEQGARFERVTHRSASASKPFVPRLLQEDWSMTIDTSGRGYKEWLEEQQQRTGVSFQKTALQTIDNSGQPGSMGLPGDIGATGQNGEPSPAPTGASGVCGVDANGSEGLAGRQGGTGGTGFPGKAGNAGGDGHPISVTIRTSTGNYKFLAHGGDGGEGGQGGQGGTGGAGGQGGAGGAGADCGCAEGGPGNGGPGGNGGRGGKGGTGGRGGPGGLGGSGANVTVKVPDNWAGFITYTIIGGRGGPGGQVGAGGFPGQGGPGGQPGAGASNFNCPSRTSTDGKPGVEFGNLGFGELGAVGESKTGERAPSGVYTETVMECAVYSGTGPYSRAQCESPLSGTCPEGSIWSGSWCECICNPSPVLVDVDGDGFNLTDADGGVPFDIDADGTREQLSWTSAGSDDAWLALDRNGNGKIDDGEELFGNYTPQQSPAVEPNGFAALTDYDSKANGGNGDGVIDSRDTIFPALRLWRDTNHNGISEPDELHTLPQLGLKTLDLHYRWSGRADRYGNLFRWRAKVTDTRDAQAGRWAWDVYLLIAR
jgi:hypothetical protein